MLILLLLGSVFINLVLSQSQCYSPYQQILPINVIPSWEVQQACKQTKLLKNFSTIIRQQSVKVIKLNNPLVHQYYDGTHKQIIGSSEVIQLVNILHERITLKVQTEVVIRIEQEVVYTGKGLLQFNQQQLNHSKIMWNRRNKLKFDFVQGYNTQIVYNSSNFVPQLDSETAKVIDKLAIEQVTPQIQSCFKSDFWNYIGVIVDKSQYEPFESQFTNYTYRDISFILNTSISYFHVNQLTILLDYNMTNLNSTSALCSKIPIVNNTQINLYISPELIKFLLNTIGGVSSYFNPLKLDSQNSSSYFQMYLCSLQDVMPSALNISTDYASQIQTRCKAILQVPNRIMNGSSSIDLTINWNCNISHSMTNTSLVSLTMNVSYSSSIVKRNNYLRIHINSFELQNLVWRQSQIFPLEDKKLAKIFVQSYLKVYLGNIIIETREYEQKKQRIIIK